MLQRVKNYYHLLQALLAVNFYRYPGKKLFVIGVTGTDGKTTTTSLIYHILKTAGKQVAMISTVGAYIDDQTHDTGFHTTTPSSFFLQKYIKKTGRQHEYLVLEVTSHALDQNRVFGIPFAIGVLTNITHEHLDYHKNYEKYVVAKVKLLKTANIAVINRDDQSYEIVNSKLKSQNAKLQRKTQKLITYGLTKNSDINPFVFPFKTNLLGDFNKHNCLAASATAREIGIDDEVIQKALMSFAPPPGRQEVIYDKDFRVMIDFAHTPNAFEQLLPTVRKITQKRIIHVFGVAGRRDYTKRPLMGKAAAKFDDIIILTSEDPRGESIAKINREIKKGIANSLWQIVKEPIRNTQYAIRSKKKCVFEIPNRKAAIEFAIGLAGKGDTVILTGKSHEKSMNYGHGEEPWDEFAVAREAIEKRKTE